MPTPKVLIIYGSVHGQTARIAARIAELLQSRGTAPVLQATSALPTSLDLSAFDGIIVAAPVRFGRHAQDVRRVARGYRHVLNAVPSAFVSVSGAATSPDPAFRVQARQYVEEFLRQTGWRPTFSETVGGAIAYTKYNPLLRWLTKRAVGQFTGPLDSSRDHEYTDWRQVERIAESFADKVLHRASPLAGVV